MDDLGGRDDFLPTANLINGPRRREERSSLCDARMERCVTASMNLISLKREFAKIRATVHIHTGHVKIASSLLVIVEAA